MESQFRYSAAARRALSETWSNLIEGSDGDAGDAWLEFYSGPMPASTDEEAPAERLLARLYIKPHTMQVLPDSAVRSGDAAWGRIIGRNGRAVVDFTVSTKRDEGFMSFNTVGFRKGGPVSCFTRMAIFSPRRRDDDED